MELYKEILAHALFHNGVSVTFADTPINTAQIVEGQCYQALLAIKNIIEDARYTDEDCFMKIEQIMETLEFIGTGSTMRHDY